MSLFLSGLDLQPADKRWNFWLSEGLDDVPEVRGGSEIVPFRAGRVYMPRTADKRALLLQGHIKASDVRAAVDEVKAVLSPSEIGRPLVWEDPLGYADPRWTNVIVQNVVAVVAAAQVRTYSVELEADPFWYSPWGANTLDAGLALDEGYLLDLSATLTVTPSTTNQLVSIVDLGSYWTERIRIEMDGPSTSAVGVHTDDTSIGFVMSAALAAGETFVLDAYARTVQIDGSNARGDMSLLAGNEHGEYIRFAPTAQDIRIVGKPAECRLIFSKTWL